MATSNKVDSENQSKVQGLNSYTKQELIDMIKYDIEEMLVENGIDDVSIVGIDLNGSRLRGDAREDSDLDVVVEYKGDFSEDGLFYILNEEPLTIEGVRININPITEEKSGTLEEYMQKSREYDQKKLQQRQQPENVSIYNSDEARRIYDEILESERTSRKLVFPAHTGALGVFEEEGKYVAFDNTTNDCWVEEFWNENIAYSWVRGEMSADDAHEIDNNLHLEKETGKQENAIASESADIVSMYDPDYSSYMNSKALYDAVQSLGTVNNKVLAGYMDYESNCYVFVGSSADIIGRYDRKHVGTLLHEDNISRPSEYMLPMSSAEGRSLFDQVSASLVHKGYRLAVIEGDYVKELVEQEETQEQKGKQSPVEVLMPEQPFHVTSAVQLNLFSDADFEASQEQTLHKAAEPMIEVPKQPQEAFDPTRIAMRQLDEGEQCYVERRYTENGYFSFAGGDHIESNADVAFIFRTLEDKSVENAFICMVKDGKPTVIHLGIGDATSVMAPIQDALLAYKALNPDKIWFIHNHPSGNLKVSREDFRLQQRMEEIFGGACQPGIIINTTSGQFMAYTAEYELGGEHLISDGQSGDKAIKTYSFDRSVFEKGWNPAKAFNGISPAGVAGFVASHRLGEHEKLSLLVLNQSGSITGNVFLPWKDIKDVCTQDGVETISQAVLQMGGNRCLLYGSEGALDNREVKALSVLQNRLKKYSIALHDVIAVERSLRMEGVIASESIEHPYVRDSSTETEKNGKHHHRLSPADREAGSALIDHLRDMGIIVHTDNRENRRILKAAQADRSETGKVRLLKNEQGDNYGFTYKGEVYLDLRKVDAELSLREYSYLWCEALRRVNPDNWNNVIETLKNDADTWSFIQAANPELHDDNDLATEAIARYSGKRGAERLQAELERMAQRDDNYKSRWNNIFQNVSKAIQDFWRHIGDSLNYRYESKDDIADQILNDFAKQVNPVRKVEKWLADRDDIYADAVKNDPDLAAQIFEEALQENIGNGITPFMAVDGYRGKLDRLAHEVKGQDNGEAIERAADLMAPLIPLYSVLVPAPSHKGMATDMLTLANAISRRTGSPVADVLKSEARESQYDAKRTTGKPLSAEALGIRMEGKLPTNYMPVVIDNVVHSGNTAEACVRALGKGVVLALASAVSQERHVASLKRLEPIVYDRDGQLIPLSKRFEMKGRRLGKAEHKKSYQEGNKRERKGMNRERDNQRLRAVAKSGQVDTSLIREATAEYVNKINSIYYQVKDFDPSSYVDRISNLGEVRPAVREMSDALLTKAVEKDPEILNRLLPVDSSQEDECERMADEALHKCMTVIDLKNGLERLMNERAESLSDMIVEYNRLKRSDDPNFMFTHPVQQYLINPMDSSPYNTEFALMAIQEGEKQFVTSFINPKEIIKKMSSIEKDLLKEYPTLSTENTKKMEKSKSQEKNLHGHTMDDPELCEAKGYMNDVISEALPNDGDKIAIRPFTVYNGDDAYTITFLYHEKAGDEHHFLASSQAGDVSIDLDHVINNISAANELVAAVLESQISQLLGSRGGIDFIQLYGSPYKIVNDSTFGELAYIKEISAHDGKVTIDGAIDNDGVPLYVKELKDLGRDGIDNLFSEVRNVVQWKPELDLTTDQAMMVADHHGLHAEVEQDLMNGMEPELALQKHHIMPTAEELAEIESLSDPCQIPAIDAVPMLLDRIIPNEGDELVLDGGGAHLDFQYIGFGYQQIEDVKSIKHVDNGYVASNGDLTVNVSRLASGPDGEYFLKVIKDSIKQENYSLSSDKVITKNSKTMAKKKSQEEEMKQQNGTEAKVESKPKKKAASKKSTEAKPEAEVKPEVEKKEEAKREKRPPQLVLEDGRQVTHVHTFPLKEEIGGGMGITGKIDGKELPTRRISDEDAKKVEAKEVKPIDLLAKYYPNQVATQLSKEQLAAVDLNHGQKLDLDATKVWMMHKGADGNLINWQDYEKMTPEEKKGIENIPMMTLSVNGEKIGTKKITSEEYDLYVNKHATKAELANKYFDAELSGGNKLSNGKTFEAWIKPSPNDAEVSLMHLKMDDQYVGAHKIKPEDAEKLQKGEVSQKDLVEKVFYNEIKGRVIELADGTKANVSVYQTRDGSPAVSLWNGNNNLGTQRIKPEEKAGIDNGTLKPADLAKTYFADKINGQEQSQSQGMSR